MRFMNKFLTTFLMKLSLLTAKTMTIQMIYPKDLASISLIP